MIYTVVSEPTQRRRLWLWTLLRVGVAAALSLMLAFTYRNPNVIAYSATALSPALVCSLYFVMACVCIWLMGNTRIANNAQIFIQATIDILFLLLLLHALGGVPSGYGLLLLFPIAAISIIASTRMSLFAAAIINISMLLDAAWQQFIFNVDPAWNLVGLYGFSVFALVIVLRTVTERNELIEKRARLAQAQADIAQTVNELSQDTQNTGVIVVGAGGVVISLNAAARSYALMAGVLLEPNDRIGLTHTLQPWLEVVSGATQTEPLPWPPANPIDSLLLRCILTNTLNINTLQTNMQPKYISTERILLIDSHNQKKQELQLRKLAEMGRLSASIAHEIRNPLAAVSQAAQLLQESAMTPAQSRMNELILQNAARIERIVSDVMNWTNQRHANTSPIDLYEAIRAATADCEARGIFAQGEIVIEITEQPLLGLFDAEHLRQILLNLLGNAARFASHTPACVRISCGLVRPGVVNLAVYDDGEKLNAHTQAHLFEPFASQDTRGTGLGLFLAQGYAQSNGGRLFYLDEAAPPYQKAFVLELQAAHLAIN